MANVNETYGIQGHIANYDTTVNLYRGESFAQPAALLPGDILASGTQVADKPFECGTAGTGLFLRTSPTDESILRLQRRIASFMPLQLRTDNNKVNYPETLDEGNVLETGEILIKPAETLVTGHVGLTLATAGGILKLAVPPDLPIAVSKESLPLDPRSPLGSLVMRNYARMSLTLRNPEV